MTQTKKFHDTKWANGYLRQALALLKEGAESEGFWLWNQRLAAAIIMKTELLGHGYHWQAERINNYIHRLQPCRADLSREREREEGSSSKKVEVTVSEFFKSFQEDF